MRFDSVATLRKLLANMERDLGLDDLNEAQRDVLYAAQLLGHESASVTIAQLRGHELTQDLPRATFFRALRNLVEQGYLLQGANRFAGYIVAGGKLDD